jgi:methylglyoxal reductase
VTQANGIATLSYSSLALGLLSGDRSGPGVFRRRPAQGQSALLGRQPEEGNGACRCHPAGCGKHGASIAQTVIAWTLAQPGVTFALCGARNPAQAIDNARAGTIRLDAADLAAIDAGHSGETD